jgi:hypothetical protein
MQTQIPLTDSALTATAEQRLTLHNVSWDTYDQLLAAFGEHRAVHCPSTLVETTHFSGRL